MNIEKNWTVLDTIKEVKAFYKRADFIAFSTEMQINFEIINKEKEPENINMKDINSSVFLKKSTSFNEKENYLIFEGYLEQVLFEKYYRDNIINNKALYSIKRASPFIFLISLLELSVNNFRNIFNINNTLSSNVLENLKVTSLVFKQTKDPYAISSSSIPMWCKDLCQNYTYLAGFNSRYLLFKCNSFDIKRSMANLYVYLKNFMGENILEDKGLLNTKRYKFKINRDNILKDTEILMKELGNYNVIIYLYTIGLY
jgi:hypothetical protein